MPAPWNDYGFTVDFTQLVPGEKLSEVDFLKHLAISQWHSIAKLVGRPAHEIVNGENQRLYGSLIDVELHFGSKSPEELGEGVHVHVRNQVHTFAKRFVEGFFVFSDEPVAEESLEKVGGKADLEQLGLPWAYMTNAFILRSGSNVALKIYQPEGFDDLPYPELEEPPAGMTAQRNAQSTGEVPELDAYEGALELRPEDPSRVRYPVVPESDLNGAGLVLFARYVAISNYGHRHFLTRQLARPFSSPLVSALSTEHRRIFYFANVQPSDTVEIEISARLLPPGSFPARPGRYRTPFKIEFRTDLYRSSDQVLMASTRVRQALRVPGDAKAVLHEADRFLRRLRSSS